MVLVNQNSNNNLRSACNKKLVCSLTLGVVFLIIPISLIFFDPVMLLVDYNFRVENGTLIHDILLTEIEGLKSHAYVFNFTNAKEFQSGKDKKLKVEEIGPFVFVEYRRNEDVEINREPGIMKLSPRTRLEFVPEESFARLENVYVIMPNILFLAVASKIANSPFLVRQAFNFYTAGTPSRAFVNISVHQFFWGYSDPLNDLGNTMIPGLVYFKTFGLLKWFYDDNVQYHMKVGTTYADKFSVKSVRKETKYELKSKGIRKKIQYFNNSYEGLAFPAGINHDTEVNIYRHNICTSLRIQHVGHRRMYYGGDALLYNFHNSTLNDHRMCDSKGWCPDGVIYCGSCYYDLPIALSKSHFLDADPQLLERVEGLSPNRKLHDTSIAIDPKISVTVDVKTALQVNIFLDHNIGFNSETKQFKETTVLPLFVGNVSGPKMLQVVKDALRIVYTVGPAVVLSTQILCSILSLLLLLYSARLMKVIWQAKNDIMLENLRPESTKAQRPLLYS